VQRTITEHLSSEHERSKARRVARYRTFLLTQQLSDTAESLARFIAVEIVGTDPNNLPTYQTVHNYFAAVAEARRREGLQSYETAPTLINFVQALRLRLPRCRTGMADPGDVYNPRFIIKKAIESLSKDPSYATRRLVALVALRSVPLLRSADVFSISRSSIAESFDMRGRRILIFSYRGKNARLGNLEMESNYIEFLSPDLEGYCPATWVKKLKEEVDSFHPTHDKLFTFLKDPQSVMKAQSLGSLVKKFLADIGLSKFTGHSVRAMASEFLEMVAHVTPEDIQRRGWKSRSARPSARDLHYRSRISHANFADLLWNPNHPEFDTLTSIAE
jgi:hypothetical protein